MWPSLAFAICLAAVLSIPAFGPALAQQPQQPTFKVSVNVVDVDVTVKDVQGNFVTGLAAEDFEVFEDGKPQTIQTFSYIELPAQRARCLRLAAGPFRPTCDRIATSNRGASTSSCSTI